MIVQHVSLKIPYGEPLYISPYSDLHMDSSVAAWPELKAHMEERAKLPNHYGILLGDMCEWILPNDLTRFRPSGSRMALDKDAIIDEMIDTASKELADTGINWLMVGSGNHEDEILKRHYVDPAARMASSLKCRYGGYAGMLVLHLHPSNSKKNPVARKIFNILYHHGAWGGRVVKGFAGARDWARMFEGWDLFVYGHNHQLVSHTETRRKASVRMDVIEDREVRIVNTGTWLKSDDSKRVTYSERRGHPPVAIGSPLIKIVTSLQKTYTFSVEI